MQKQQTNKQTKKQKKPNQTKKKNKKQNNKVKKKKQNSDSFAPHRQAVPSKIAPPASCRGSQNASPSGWGPLPRSLLGRDKAPVAQGWWGQILLASGSLVKNTQGLKQARSGQGERAAGLCSRGQVSFSLAPSPPLLLCLFFFFGHRV